MQESPDADPMAEVAGSSRGRRRLTLTVRVTAERSVSTEFEFSQATVVGFR
jgi:hypothetical protein